MTRLAFRALTLFVLLWKTPSRERAIGDYEGPAVHLPYVCCTEAGNGLAPYSWNIVFLIPWMRFATLLLGALVVSATAVGGNQQTPSTGQGAPLCLA